MTVLPRFRQRAGWIALIGGGLLLASLAWWASVFLRIIGIGYLSAPEALSCSVASSIVCDLATSLCGRTHPWGVTWYSPVLLWASVALLSVSALIWRETP